MHDGHQQDAWIHTTNLIVQIVNSNPNRDPKSRPVQFSDLYPFGKKVTTEDAAMTDAEIKFESEMAKAHWMAICKRNEQ